MTGPQVEELDLQFPKNYLQIILRVQYFIFMKNKKIIKDKDIIFYNCDNKKEE